MKTALTIIALVLCAGFCIAKPQKGQLTTVFSPAKFGKETIG